MPPLRSLKVAPKSDRHWYDYATGIAYLCAFSVLAAGGFFLLKPRYDAIMDIRTQVAFSQEQLRAKEQLRSRIETLISNAGSLTPKERSQLEYFLPKTPDLPGLFVQTERLTQASGMRLLSLDAQEQGSALSAPFSGVFGLPFSLKYETGELRPYAVLKQSLLAFESNLRLFDILDFSFEVKEAQESTGDAGKEEKRQMQMKLSTYYFPEKP